ncbi:MAG: hypothetical protein KA369_19815 [Spirochaetes bacterium]|nr:hypothetical protein [Spirochaetota bacterium]
MNGKKAFIIAANLVIAIFVIQTHLKPFPDMVLKGAEQKIPLQMPTGADLFSGKFQAAVDQWLKQHVGFRGFFIKCDNQVNYSLFSEFSRNNPRKVVLGKDKYLYEQPYIDYYNRINQAKPEALEAKAVSLKLLQEKLLKKNVRLLLLITSSKTSIYPEFLPDRFILRDNLGKNDEYQNFLPVLRKHGINHIDGRELLLQKKAASEPNLYPTSGSHWSLYGSYFFTTALVDRIERLLGKRVTHIGCKKVARTREPLELDSDIARLGNILFTRSLFTEYLYPETYPVGGAGSYKPSMLMVGTSFCWNIIPHLEKNGFFSRLNFYYYFNTDHSFPAGRHDPIDKARVDWKGDIFKRDIILIEINEIAFNETGFGFIEEALRELDK